MGMENKISEMETGIQDSILMEWLMDMDNIIGVMEVSTREISNMVSDMDMEYGQTIWKHKFFLGVIEWIKRKGSVFMSG